MDRNRQTIRELNGKIVVSLDFLYIHYKLYVLQLKTQTLSSGSHHNLRWMTSVKYSHPISELWPRPHLIYIKVQNNTPYSSSFIFFPPTWTDWVPPWLAPDSLHVLAGLEPPNPSSFSNSAAAAVWSMIPLIITATLSPLSHPPNWHSQGQLSADCLHRLELH